MTTCSCGCGKPLTKGKGGRGLCEACYQRQYRAKVFTPRTKAPPCACGQPHYAKGKCLKCYDAMRYSNRVRVT